MMSPKELIETSYVLRKDSWGENIGLYQRLLTEKRLKKIRKFVIDNINCNINCDILPNFF